jgi:proteasome lid subunit RPN8/RPN11
LTLTDRQGLLLLAQVSADSEHQQSEYGGVVYEQNGELCATQPNQGDGTRVEIHAFLPKGAKLVALYHTHLGPGDASEQFSEADIDGAKRLNVASYILVLHSHAIRRFIFGQDRSRLIDDNGKTFSISYGTRVSNGESK